MAPGVALDTLAELRMLQNLCIHSPSIQDADLSFLRHLKNLKALDFTYTAVTGKAMGWLPSPNIVESVSLGSVAP